MKRCDRHPRAASVRRAAAPASLPQRALMRVGPVTACPPAPMRKHAERALRAAGLASDARQFCRVPSASIGPGATRT
jgi:ferredoxin-NADP reductase